MRGCAFSNSSSRTTENGCLRTWLMSDAVSGDVALPRILAVDSAVWNSLMSRRIRRSSEPNRYSAAVLASSVLPVPVGPANRNTPIGLLGIVQPGLEHGDAIDDAR